MENDLSILTDGTGALCALYDDNCHSDMKQPSSCRETTTVYRQICKHYEEISRIFRDVTTVNIIAALSNTLLDSLLYPILIFII